MNFARAATIAMTGAGLVALAAPAHATTPKPARFPNCATLQALFKHGVARPGAHDAVRGATAPVTTFTINKAFYDLNRHLDRDKDGVACEKR